MKKVLTFIYLFFVASCSQSKKPKYENIVKSNKVNASLKLIENDFLKYVDHSKIESFKKELINNFNIYEEENFRFAHIDAEELAEFSFDMFLPELQRMLTKRNFQLQVQKLNDDEYSNDILINGETLQLYSEQDMNYEIFWETASINFFRKLNQQIKSKNIDEQFYLLYGGNDLQVLLLTEKQFSIIAEYYNDNPNDKPYIP